MADLRKRLVLLNTVSLAIMLSANVASSAALFSQKTVASVSYKYGTLFAPAGYAFSIWGLIFLLCIGFVGYQWFLVRTNDPNGYIERTGIWFTVSNLANTLWLYCWISEFIGLSVVVICILLFSLVKMVLRLRMELDDEPVLTVLLVWWPIVIYLGWIMVATIACISSWLVYIDWQPLNIRQDVWTMIMIAISTSLFAILVKTRNQREAALVGAWAFIAIAVRHKQNHIDILITSLVCTIILLTIIALHGYKHRDTNLLSKAKRGEWY